MVGREVDLFWVTVRISSRCVRRRLKLLSMFRAAQDHLGADGGGVGFASDLSFMTADGMAFCPESRLNVVAPWSMLEPSRTER